MRKSELLASKHHLINITALPADVINLPAPTSVPSPYPIGRKSAGALIHNYNATGTATATLPPDAQPGEYFEVQEVTAQNIVLDPGATGLFIDGATTGGASKTLTSSAQGSQVKIICIDAGPTWLLRGKSGTWTIAS